MANLFQSMEKKVFEKLENKRLIYQKLDQM